MGVIQFERYPELLAKREQYIEKLDKGLSCLKGSNGEPLVALMKHNTDNYDSTGHLYLVNLLDRIREEANKVIEQMAERGISCNIHCNHCL